jgi:hypothetical protein
MDEEDALGCFSDGEGRRKKKGIVKNECFSSYASSSSLPYIPWMYDKWDMMREMGMING